MISLEEALGIAIPTRTLPKPEQTLTPFQKTHQERIEQLVTKLIQDNNMTKVCKEMGISRTTGYEYWHIWEQTEEAQYVNAEWWGLYHQVKQTHPTVALKMLTNLKLRFHPEKFEVKAELTSTETINYNFTEEERLTLVNARRLLRDKEGSTSRPDKLH
jgi:hypothetical protein